MGCYFCGNTKQSELVDSERRSEATGKTQYIEECRDINACKDRYEAYLEKLMKEDASACRA